MNYDGIDSTILQNRLSEAQDVYYALAVGDQTVSVKMGDKAVSFTPADLNRLGQYIRELRGALGVYPRVYGESKL